MNEEKAVEIFELARKGEMLPEKIDDLVPLSFIGQAAVDFFRNKLRLMDQIGITEEQRKITLRDGQEAGGLLLDIEARIGEICLQEPDAIPKRTFTNGKFEKTSGKPVKHKRLGLAHGMRISQAQRIAQNPEIVEQVKAKAIESDDIPTKTAVISEIRYQKEKKRRKKAEGKQKKLRIEIELDQQIYLTALDRCLLVLPQEPPKDWNPEALGEATGKAKIIMRRLEVFNESV